MSGANKSGSGVKKQGTLSGFISLKKAKVSNGAVTSKQKPYIFYDSVNKAQAKATKKREIVAISSDSDDEIQITGVNKLFHKKEGFSGKDVGKSQYFNNRNSYSEYARKTTMESVTTEKSVQTFQKIENLAFKHRPRLSKSPHSSFNEPVQSVSTGGIQFSDEQMEVLNLIVEQNQNVFFTGSAGTGKSVLLREIIRRLVVKYHREDLVAVTASTGLAAVNIGGQTIHRFAGIGIGEGNADVLAKRVMKNQNSLKRWKATKVLVLDEISMIDGDLFTKLCKVAQMVRKNDKPFGGIQVILTGDFFQLPPVPDRYSQRTPKYAFQSPEWKNVVQRTILLSKVFRQRGDTELIDMLNTVRLGNCDASVTAKFQKLAREVHYSDNIQPTELYPTRNEVNFSNSTRLEKLPGKPRKFKAKDVFSGQQPYIQEQEKKMLDNMLAPEELVLKENAQVLMLKNVDDFLVNGTVGMVLTFLTEPLYVQILNDFGKYNLDSPFILEQIRFISNCIGGFDSPEEENAAKEWFQKFTKAERHRMKPFINDASKAPKSAAYPLVAFSIPGMEERKKIELITPQEFSINYSGKTCARHQVPLLLSWALSIHKSQGQTLDRVKVNLEKTFEKGQVYVALSRATSQDRLQILNFTASKIRASEDVIKFYADLEKLK